MLLRHFTVTSVWSRTDEKDDPRGGCLRGKGRGSVLFRGCEFNAWDDRDLAKEQEGNVGVTPLLPFPRKSSRGEFTQWSRKVDTKESRAALLKRSLVSA